MEGWRRQPLMHPPKNCPDLQSCSPGCAYPQSPAETGGWRLDGCVDGVSTLWGPTWFPVWFLETGHVGGMPCWGLARVCKSWQSPFAVELAGPVVSVGFGVDDSGQEPSSDFLLMKVIHRSVFLFFFPSQNILLVFSVISVIFSHRKKSNTSEVKKFKYLNSVVVPSPRDKRSLKVWCISFQDLLPFNPCLLSLFSVWRLILSLDTPHLSSWPSPAVTWEDALLYNRVRVIFQIKILLRIVPEEQS